MPMTAFFSDHEVCTMTYSRWNFLYRGALQLAILLAVTPNIFAATPVASPGERPLIGHMVVTAARLTLTSVVAADLGSMTVTALRQEMVARNDGPHAARVPL